MDFSKIPVPFSEFQKTEACNQHRCGFCCHNGHPDSVQLEKQGQNHYCCHLEYQRPQTSSGKSGEKEKELPAGTPFSLFSNPYSFIFPFYVKRLFMLFSPIISVEVLCKSAVVVGCNTPATPNTIRRLLKPTMVR